MEPMRASARCIAPSFGTGSLLIPSARGASIASFMEGEQCEMSFLKYTSSLRQSSDFPFVVEETGEGNASGIAGGARYSHVQYGVVGEFRYLERVAAAAGFA